jgi:hypothetical protein
MKRFLLQSVATAAILLAAGCSAPTTTNDQVGAENAADNAIAAGEMGVDESAEGSLAIAPPPSAPAGLSSDDAAPLGQAAQIASEIDSEADVERVPFEGGWAWRRNGQILRTSSRDGRRVSYFRPGESAPFFVQQGEESFAYSGGHARRAYDRGGRAVPVAPARRDDAQRLADQSRHDRDAAEHAPSPPRQPNPPNRGQDRPDQHGRPGADHGASPGAGPSNGNSASEPAGHDRNARTDRRRARPTEEDTNRMGRRGP